jgi:L-seryl-tRNA(Ser) seleniumtransferase
MTDARKDLPSVSALLESAPVRQLLESHPHALVVEALRAALEDCRAGIAACGDVPALDSIAGKAADALADRERDRLRPVVNAAGILLHTGLGRAVLPEPAAKALAGLDRCCNLQIDLETGLRGKRNHRTEQLLCRLTGAEAAMVVNNNAAATLLMLTALCRDREVIVSRGQLIEIGGSYRLPDCVHQSGAHLVEVGTTNKTHLRDYEAAITENTGALMRVNPSNYRVVGFSKEVSVGELVSLKKKQDVLVLDDLGCGALRDLREYGLPHEPTAPESIAAGADLVCFSGDKLIGGPQAGIIIGRADLIRQIRKHPLTRMLRVGKLTDMALEQTLRLFLEPEKLAETNPTLRMLALKPEELKKKAQRLARRLKKNAPAVTCEVIPCESALGGGALPATPIPSWGIAVSVDGLSANQLLKHLRKNEPPVIARVADDAVILDMRTLMEEEERIIEHAVGEIMK